MILGQRLPAERTKRAFRRSQPVNPVFQFVHFRQQRRLVAVKLGALVLERVRLLLKRARSVVERRQRRQFDAEFFERVGLGGVDRPLQAANGRVVLADLALEFGAGVVQLAFERVALRVEVAQLHQLVAERVIGGAGVLQRGVARLNLVLRGDGAPRSGRRSLSCRAMSSAAAFEIALEAAQALLDLGFGLRSAARSSSGACSTCLSAVLRQACSAASASCCCVSAAARSAWSAGSRAISSS